MIIAGIRMISECARTAGSAIPMRTKNPVQNFPKSATAFPLDSKSSGLAHRPQIQFGRGARTYVATTRRGKYCLKSAQERITRRNPIARTKESEIMVFRPAVIFAIDRGSLTMWCCRFKAGKWVTYFSLRLCAQIYALQ